MIVYSLFEHISILQMNIFVNPSGAAAWPPLFQRLALICTFLGHFFPSVSVHVFVFVCEKDDQATCVAEMSLPICNRGLRRVGLQLCACNNRWVGFRHACCRGQRQPPSHKQLNNLLETTQTHTLLYTNARTKKCTESSMLLSIKLKSSSFNVFSTKFTPIK